MTPAQVLQTLVTRWLRRVRLLSALNWAVRGLLAGVMLGVGLAIVARVQPTFFPVEVMQFAAAAMLSLTAAAALIAYLWPRPTLPWARWFDLRLGLAERVSTALELAANPHNTPGWLLQQQADDALAQAHAVRVRDHLPVNTDWREIAALIVAITALAFLLLWPNDILPQLTQQREVAAAVDDQIEAIEALRDDILADDTLTDEQQQALLEPLDEALDELDTPGITQEQAVSVLSEAEQSLQALTDPNALQQQITDLQQAGEQLTADGALSETGAQLSAGDLAAAAEALANLDLSSLSAAELAELAAELGAMADQLANSNPALAENLQAAADAIASGDLAAAQAALDAAAQQLQQTASAQVAAASAAAAASQLGQGADSVAQAGQAGQASQAGQGQQGTGQGSGQGEGQGGEGTGGEGSGVGGGSGSGSGAIDGATGQESTAPDGSGNVGDGGEADYEPIYSPIRLGGSGGPEVDLPGNGGEGDEVTALRPSDPTDDGDATVPYDEVFPVYAGGAYEAIESGEVPVTLKPIVRDYFSSLDPQR